jgi:hypothetical protein
VLHLVNSALLQAMYNLIKCAGEAGPRCLVLQAGAGRAFLAVKRGWVAVLSLLRRRIGEVSLRFEEAEAMGEEVGEHI